MKRLFLVLIAVMLFVTPAFADWFGQGCKDVVNLGPKECATQKVGLPIPPPDDFMASLANVLNNLGSRAGFAYDFKRGEKVTYIGSTIVTKYNVALDLGMLNADGVALTVDYNIGAILPAQIGNEPILKYVTYLYVGGGYGMRYNSNDKAWGGGLIADAQFKFNF